MTNYYAHVLDMLVDLIEDAIDLFDDGIEISMLVSRDDEAQTLVLTNAHDIKKELEKALVSLADPRSRSDIINENSSYITVVKQ